MKAKTCYIPNQVDEAELIVETTIAFASSVFPAQLNRLPNEKMVISDIYIEIAMLEESEATQRKTDSEPQHESDIRVKRLKPVFHTRTGTKNCITDRLM